MDEIHKKRKRSIAFRLGSKYLIQKISKIQSDERIGYVLSDAQKQQLKLLRLRVYLIAGLIGVLAVLAVIFPFYLSHFFDAQHLNFFGIQIDFEFNYMVYSILMIFPEIWLLNILNIYAVKRICEIFQYPSTTNSDYLEQIALLTEAGLEMPSKHMQLLDINPYVGLTKFSYYLLFIGAKLKAALSNVLMKFLVKGLLGRYALRIVTDLLGIPIYAFWDAWSSRNVMKEAQIRIVSNAATEDFLVGFTSKELRNEKELLTKLIHFIAQQKRQYNFALYSFIKGILNLVPDLDLKYKKQVHLEELFGEDKEQNILIARLLIFGLIVDGTLSVKERLTIRKIAKEEWFPMKLDEIETVLKAYIKGDGLKRF